MRNVLRLVMSLCVAAAWMCALRPASAQSPLAIGFEEAFTPDFLRRDLPAFSAELGLDDEQSAIFDSLLGDYQEQFEKALAGVREGLRDAQSLLGAEDPEIDRQREELRTTIASLFEQMQEQLANLQPGQDAGEIRTKFEADMGAAQEALQALQSQRPAPEEVAKLFADASARLEAWRGVKRQMRDKFIGDAQALLRDDQRERWPALERRLLRDKTLPRGRLQGESVNLLTLVRELGLDEAQQQAVAPLVADYEMRLDQALRSRNDLTAAADQALFQAVQSQDRAALQRTLERIVQARVAVRAANDDSAAAIAAALPEDVRGRFLTLWHDRAYPLVYRDTQTMRLVKAAREIGGLSVEQTTAIEVIQKEYEQELLVMNEDVLRAVRAAEPAEMTLREAHRLMPPTAEQEQVERDRTAGPMQEAFRKRTSLGRGYTDRLAAVVGPEFFERLPRGEGEPGESARTVEGSTEEP